MLRAIALGVMLAGTAGFSFAQLPSPQFPPMNQGGAGIPGYPGSGGQMGQMGSGGRNPGTRSFNSITGSVRTSDNQPINDVRVELRDASTGTIVSSSSTGMAGSFEFHQLQQGFYEVVATSGTARAEEQVQVNSQNTSVELRLPVTTKPNDGISGNTVSVNQYRVPEAARDELRKAQDAASKNKGEEAIRHLDRALEIQPNYANALSLRAAFRLDSKDIPGAMEDAQKAIDNDANFALAYTVMGSALNMQMKFDDALRSLQRAETLAPDVWQTYFEIGRAYIGKKDYAMAMPALDRAEKLGPQNYSLIQLVHANCLLQMGRNNEAATELQQYIARNPNSKWIEQAKDMLGLAQSATESARNH